jgi:hypothetical protein
MCVQQYFNKGIYHSLVQVEPLLENCLRMAHVASNDTLGLCKASIR